MVLGLAVCLFFLGLALDSKFFQKFIDSSFAAWAPAFWTCTIVGGLGAIGCAAALIRPPVVLAADARGVAVGAGFTWSFGRRSALVPWDQVENIGVGEVRYWSNEVEVVQQAVRIVCDASVDLSPADDMLGVQTGTAAYFAAKASQRGKHSVKWDEPGGMRAPHHVVLIGERNFSENVHQVVERLLSVAAIYAPRVAAAPPAWLPREST
jgi:hypothetical protein